MTKFVNRNQFPLDLQAEKHCGISDRTMQDIVKVARSKAKATKHAL